MTSRTTLAAVASVAFLASLAVSVGAVTPAGAAPSNDAIIAIRGNDNAVWVRTLPSGSAIGALRGWQSLGGATASSPAVSSDTILIRGLDNAVWVNEHESSSNTWTGWQSLGGATTDQPTTNSYGDVFIRGVDGAVHTRYHKSAYDPWLSLGGTVTGPPAVASDTAIAVRGADNSVYLNRAGASGWGGWQALGGTTTDTPSAALVTSSTVRIAIRGLDAALWVQDVPESGPPSGWASRGGTIIGSPVVDTGVLAFNTVLARSSGATLYRNGNSGWAALPGLYAGPVGLGELGLVGRGLDDALYLLSSELVITPLGGATQSAPAGSPATVS